MSSTKVEEVYEPTTKRSAKTLIIVTWTLVLMWFAKQPVATAKFDEHKSWKKC